MGKRKDDGKILDVNAAMQGTLIFSDPVNLRINGTFEGNLKTLGNLIVGEQAKITADIEGENIIISGLIQGNIKSTGVITLTASANVFGNIETTKFCIQEGAIFNGSCKMFTERLTLPELSEYLSVDSNKIVEWVNNGKIPAQKEGSELLFDRRELEVWVEQNR
jgi:excisionase family DNA binding protein